MNCWNGRRTIHNDRNDDEGIGFILWKNGVQGLRMENNIKLVISVGNSRTAKYWQQEQLTWESFLDRLSKPKRTQEAFQQYKAMKKSEQDELKDVGGFLGGTLKNGRRKKGYVLTRCLITLDADSIAPGGKEDTIKRVSGLGCAYAIYSTRKHESAAPRLRILFPTDRPLLPDEYEPIARKVAALIGMEIFDPTTFEPERFMYFPSCSADSEWVFTYEDKPFLKADGILGQYQDWKNVLEWPEVPGIQKQLRQTLKKQGNPREKPGIIGAFCRVYDIPAAIDKFIPDVYEDYGNGRYTYCNGSTAAGAVLYDEGMFLFSHHATDPAGGRLLNPFDLVRVHLFGQEDENATEGTPGNRMPSFTKMCEFAAQDEAVRLDLAKEAFSDEGREKEPYPDIKIGAKGTITVLPTTRNLETLLNNEGLNISYDMIKREIKVKSQDKEAMEKFNGGPNSYGNLLTYCTDQFARDGLRTSTAKVHEWVTKVADDNKVNAAREYLEFNYMLYGGSKGIDALFECLKVMGDADLYKMLLRKWLCQGVAMAYNEHGQFGADGVLVLKGPHGIGKTSFFRKCCTIGQDYFAEGAMMDGSKDKLMEATQCWIGELGELPRSLKDIEMMKAFITSPSDKFRAPYAKKAEIYPRLASFGATTNSDSFLKEDGERRFWVIDVENIDLVGLDRISFEAVWAEAMDLYRLLGQLSFRLTKAERDALRRSNKQYQIISDEERLLREKLDWEQPKEQWKEFTATALCERLSPGRGLSGVRVGRALKNIGYEKDSEEYPMRIKDGYPIYLTPSKTILTCDMFT